MLKVKCCWSALTDDFGTGISIIVSLVKDKLGDNTDVNNYSGISLSSVISKVFEHCLLNKFQTFIDDCDLQFGFKKKLSCSHAVFVLCQCIEYFVTCGSTVFMAALDAKKAFDHVNHIKVFMKLLDNGLPVYTVRLLVDWYSKLYAGVKWEGCISSLFLYQKRC